MASFLSSALRLAFKRNPGDGHLRSDDEKSDAGGVFTEPIVPGAAAHAVRTRSYLISNDDPLSLYRLMLGITSSPVLGFDESSPAGPRPASNLGIYARVVYAEQKAKDSFKVFNTLINGCYFFQIIVAASLTAMGAASASSRAITAFGAINTIIAGVLTFLKGSGLPNRLKYYGGEWKKVREFIEQRERDFSRIGCNLDVYEVVQTIEQMYAHVQQEIEVNTPDAYTSISNLRNAVQNEHRKTQYSNGARPDLLHPATHKQVASVNERLHNMSQDFRERTHGIAEMLHIHEHERPHEVHKPERAVVRGEDSRASLDRHMSSPSQTFHGARNVLGGSHTDLRDTAERHISQSSRDLSGHPSDISDATTRHVSDTYDRAVADTRAEATTRFRRAADELSKGGGSASGGGRRSVSYV